MFSGVLGVDGYIKLGVVGLTLIALGLAWLPCSQSIIMSGYEFGKQGKSCEECSCLWLCVVCKYMLTSLECFSSKCAM